MPTFGVLYNTIGLIEPGQGTAPVVAQPSMGFYDLDIQSAYPYSLFDIRGVHSYRLMVNYAAHYQTHVDSSLGGGFSGGGGAGPAESAAARAARYGLVAAWGLDGLTDSFGSNTLTNNGGATFAAGKLGNAVYLNRSTPQWLSLATDPGLGDVDFMVAVWVWLDALTGTQTAITKSDGSQFAYDLYHFNGKWRFYVERSGDSSEVVANTFGNTDAGAYHLAIGCHDSVGDLVSICVDGGAWDSTPHVGGVRTDAFAVGIGSYGVAGLEPLGGRLDGAYFFKSPPGGIAAIMDEIKAYIWNSGTGREYPGGWA